ncbi:MAG TPA: ribulose-phosphate 3-epimerase [Cryomorphaceae bacterium]|jgi:ribulose-phosphate 3-epimerase|nr:MAG: ribulose phosphate epimerase [Cryomorphaceae bacterium BACL7 MAG-120910-bin2]KRO69647.1 MAG: ribulose phosphate epimerase [Cryomorphaceae bacterium BACL7 MAG-120322-bin74]KRO83468.1 MAG: ribulose phosphate epimerase [Cryomorphaceae bacterium BACL7 MAG-121220-bin83]HAB32155.1 ribulose-phosphate 3-epimerase [Cryomorphaceae bacterium]HAG49399.1 ribulose-phosphate 3-epimerase [Cryomorphaceae bacterium]|tara:strand:+ start:797 stop:1438 length:642 start_codon:yes stop_codon:yes gene_type:complete
MIAPSILSADFANLQRDVEMINGSEAAWIHIDVMDGVFVPNLSFGLPVVAAIHQHATKPLDVHLMIVQPERYIKEFKAAGAHVLTVHYEASTHLHRTLQAIRAEGMLAGVALNPHTPVSALQDVLLDLDLVCLMSVNPGFGGQSFIPQTFQKVKQLRAMLQEAGSKAFIEIDGGVNANNAAALKEAGADVLVAGNSVFKAADPVGMIAELHGA